MFVDSRELASGHEITTDVCVIGAGAAGVTIADALDRKGIAVAVLESGGFAPDPATTDLAVGRNTGVAMHQGERSTLDEDRLRYYGGTSNHWAGWCKPFTDAELGPQPHLGEPGWPITLRDLEPYYRQVYPYLQLGPYGSDWRYWNDAHRTGAPWGDHAAFETRLTQISGAVRLGARLRARLDTATRVTVYLWANVVRIGLAPDGSRVDQLDVATLTGRRFTVRARRVVLATGGIEVPRLLLASNDVHTAGVGNGNDLVGRMFMEHIDVNVGEAILAAPVSRLKLYTTQPTGTDETAPALNGNWTITPEAQRAHALSAIEVSSLVAEPLDAPTVAKLRPNAKDEVPLPGIEDLLRRASTPGASYHVMRGIVGQSPNARSRVRLDDARDALGMPRVVLEWNLARIDYDTIARGTALFAAGIGAQGLGRVRLRVNDHTLPPKALDELGDVRYPVGVSAHHMGTARMATTPQRGVVDATCAVHGVPNLFIAGCAVFPTVSTATPTATLLALTLRLADHLASST